MRLLTSKAQQASRESVSKEKHLRTERPEYLIHFLFGANVSLQMIPSGPKKPQVALPANEMQEIAPPDDVKAKITFCPPIDLFFDPKEEAIMLLMDLPGASKDDICIEVGEGFLSICGPRSKNELKERFGGQLQIMAHERQTGYYCRRFQLPSNALEDTMAAQFNAGKNPPFGSVL